MYMLKYKEYMVAGREFDFKDGDMPLFREQYAIDIFH